MEIELGIKVDATLLSVILLKSFLFATKKALWRGEGALRREALKRYIGATLESQILIFEAEE